MAIRKQFDLKKLDFDLNAWKREMRREMEEEIKEAAREWLRTVIAIVPVWSRASHATFKPLADAVGFVIPTQPLESRKDRSDLGESVSRGELEITDDTFHFIYETNLRYLAFNEFNAAGIGDSNIFAGLDEATPYNFTGRAAEVFRARSPQLPNPFEYLRPQRL